MGLCVLSAGLAAAEEAGVEEHAKPWAKSGELQFRLVYSDVRLDLEASDVDGTDDPLGTSPANRRIDYDARHTSARVELAYGLPLGDTLHLEAFGGIGWGFSALSVEAEGGSVLNPSGPDQETTAESFADFTLSLGFNARLFLGDALFVGGGYAFLYGRTEYDSQFFYSLVDIRQDYTIHDLSFVAGTSLDFFSVWAGVGFVVYWSDLDIDERGGPDRWDVDLSQGDGFFKGIIGAALHASHLSASLQLEFVPDVTARIAAGWTF